MSKDRTTLTIHTGLKKSDSFIQHTNAQGDRTIEFPKSPMSGTINIEHETSETYFLRGKAFAQFGEEAKAATQFIRALAIDSKDGVLDSTLLAKYQTAHDGLQTDSASKKQFTKALHKAGIDEKLNAYINAPEEKSTALQAYKARTMDKPHPELTTSMHLAAHHNRLDLVIDILQAAKNSKARAALLNAQDELGLTPLDIAATHGSIKTAEYLAGLGGKSTNHIYDQPLLLPKALIAKPATLAYVAFNGAATLKDHPEYQAQVNSLKEKSEKTDHKHQTADHHYKHAMLILDEVPGIQSNPKFTPGQKEEETFGAVSLASHILDQAITANPYHAASYKERGLCHIVTGKPDEAIQDLSRAVHLDKEALNILSIDRNPAYNLKSYQARASERLEEAQAQLDGFTRDAQTRPQEFATILVSKAEQHVTELQGDKAQTAISMAKKIDPKTDSGFINHLVGYARLAKKRPQETAHHLVTIAEEQCFENNSSNAQTAINLAKKIDPKIDSAFVDELIGNVRLSETDKAQASTNLLELSAKLIAGKLIEEKQPQNALKAAQLAKAIDPTINITHKTTICNYIMEKQASQTKSTGGIGR